MNPFQQLSADNHEQIRKFLQFFRQKKDGILRSIQLEFEDAKYSRLDENMYTKDDVLDYTEYLTSAVKTHLSADISAIVNMGALAINQLLENAQMKGIELNLETGALENHVLLDQVDKMSLDSLPKTTKRATTLASFKDEAKAMKEESDRMDDANRKLAQEVNNLKLKLKSAEYQALQLSESKKADDEMQLRSLEEALEEAKEENAKRVSDTIQFQQMRKIMQEQSAKIRKLTQRLQKYEPDGCKEDIDDT